MTRESLPKFQPLNVRGASLWRGERHYVLRLDRPYTFLSSAPLGEGLLDCQWMLSLEVGPDDDVSYPVEYLRSRATSFGVPASEPLIGLLTAVLHRDIQVVGRSEDGVTVVGIATVGVSNASGPGQRDVPMSEDALPERAIADAPGTINQITLIDADLSHGALVRASTMITEAKTLALAEAGITTRNGSAATGTSTDVTVVGHSGRGIHFDYAGSATLAGWMAADTAYEAVSRGIRRCIHRMKARNRKPEDAGNLVV